MYGFPGAAHHEVENDVGVRRRESAEFGGQGIRQQEIVGRDESLHLAFQPLLALVVLTMGAETVTAGMRNETLVIAVAALHLHHRAGRTAALANRRERPELVNAQAVAKLREEVGFKLADDGREADHRGAPLARE